MKYYKAHRNELKRIELKSLGLYRSRSTRACLARGQSVLQVPGEVPEKSLRSANSSLGLSNLFKRNTNKTGSSALGVLDPATQQTEFTNFNSYVRSNNPNVQTVIQVNGPLGDMLSSEKRNKRKFEDIEKKETQSARPRLSLLLFKKKFQQKISEKQDVEQNFFGPPLLENTLIVPRKIRVVKYVTLGEAHMVLHGTESDSRNEVVYGAGDNRWGQLGLNPFETLFIDHLVPLNVDVINQKQYNIQQVDCGRNHTLMLYLKKDPATPSLASHASRTKKHLYQIVQLGNIYANKDNSLVMQLGQRGKNKNMKDGNIPINLRIEDFYKGLVVELDQKQEYKVKFIRAAYNRSCAVTQNDKVYIWGFGFKNEKVEKPKLLFQDEQGGILDVQFGLRHGVYLQKKTNQAFSWGDRTFGQTGNNYSENFTNASTSKHEATGLQTFFSSKKNSATFKTANQMEGSIDESLEYNVKESHRGNEILLKTS